MFTSIFKPFHVQFRTVGDEILRSRLFRAIVQLADVFAHQVINALAPDVIVARLYTMKGAWNSQSLEDMSL